MPWIIKYLDAIDLIRKADTYAELVKIKRALGDEAETVLMSNRKIQEALKLVNEKIHAMDKDKVIQEILEMLF